jgi:hypothetical protein
MMRCLLLPNVAAQKLQDEEQIELQESFFRVNAAGHFQAMCEVGGVTDQDAEAFRRHIKNARSELVSFVSKSYMLIRSSMCVMLSLVTGHMVYATRGETRPTSFSNSACCRFFVQVAGDGAEACGS